MVVVLGLAGMCVAGGCSAKSDEQKLVDRLTEVAKSGDSGQAADVYDVDLRLRASVIAAILAVPPASQPAAADQDLPVLTNPDALASQKQSVANELLKGAVADDLRAGDCEWTTDVSSAEAAALALPDVKHGMAIPLHNAIVDLQNAVGHTELGHLKCASGHEYPIEIVQRRDDGSPWKVLRIGLPPKGN